MNQSSQSKHHLLAAVAEANINKRTIPACFIEEVRKKSGIPERTFVWIGRYRRMSKGYEHRVQTSETLIELVAIRLMLNRLTES